LSDKLSPGYASLIRFSLHNQTEGAPFLAFLREVGISDLERLWVTVKVPR
jgi:hypothetical protein